MGYWQQDTEGHSFAESSPELIWGDSPADIMDDALDQIEKVFRRDVLRWPSKAEIIAGLQFSLRVRDELPDLPTEDDDE